MDRLRIALVTRAFSWENAGGGEVLVRLLAEGLAKAGHDVHVLAVDLRGVPRDAPFSLTPLPRLSMLAVRRALREAKPDVVDAHNMESAPAAIAAARSLRLPVVVTANSAWGPCLFADIYRPGHGTCVTCSVEGVRDCFARRPPEEIGRRVPATIGYLETRRRMGFLRLADRVVVHSVAARDVYRRNGVDDGRLRVVPNFDEPTFHQEPRPEGKRILFVGALRRTKGPDLAVRALAALPPEHADARLVLAGVGGFRDALLRLADELGVGARVDFLGYVPHERVRELYATARAVVFPSRAEEAFGRVILEAWGSGVPVVATSFSAPGEIVEDGVSGLLFRNEDATDLARQLARALGDGPLRAQLVRGGREALARYAPEAIVPRFVAVYQEVARR